MEPEEPIYVETDTVGCDGGGGQLGHPRVYLKFDASGEIVCPYCSRHYILVEGAQQAGGH